MTTVSEVAAASFLLMTHTSPTGAGLSGGALWRSRGKSFAAPLSTTFSLLELASIFHRALLSLQNRSWDERKKISSY